MIDSDLSIADAELLDDWTEVMWHDGMRIYEDYINRSVVASVKPFGKPTKIIEIFESEVIRWQGFSMQDARKRLFREINDRFRTMDISDHWMSYDV
jgi:hypothetical protein